MKEVLLQLGRYNVWANKLMAQALLQLDAAQLDMEMQSSFPTIRKTVYHMWSAEDIWLQRLQLAEQPVWAESVFKGEFADAVKKWEQVSKKLAGFVDKQFSDESFSHVMQYYNLKKQPQKVPVYVCLTQAFNHATYHRAQLVTMMRQAGVKKIPGTDFHIFATK